MRKHCVTLQFILWILSLSLFSDLPKVSGCPRHDLETVYGGYNLTHSVSEYLYDIDVQTFDLAAAGKSTIIDKQSCFIYFIEEHACEVKWHYLIGSEVLDSFHALAVRSERDRVYGVAKIKTEYYTIELDTDGAANPFMRLY